MSVRRPGAPAASPRPTTEALHEYDVALCFSDHHQAPAPWKETAYLCLVAELFSSARGPKDAPIGPSPRTARVAPDEGLG